MPPRKPPIVIPPLPPSRRWPVTLHVPAQPLYMGTYVRVPITIQARTKILFGDLEFSVPAGRVGGQVSLSRDATFNPKKPEVMLLAGFRPGAYTLRCTNRLTGKVLGEARFAVTDMWHDGKNGPNLWFNGILPGYSFGATWGGGNANEPQNMNTIPATGTRQVAVLMVDTSDQRYSTTAATFNGFVSRWDQNLLTGEIGADGVARSTAQYYQEVSLGNLTITGQVFNQAVHLSGVWTDYFTLDSNNLWAPLGEYCNQCVAAAGGTWDLTGFNMIVCVCQSVAGTGGAANRIAWPYGGITINVDTPFGRVTSRGVSISNEWGDGSAFDLGLVMGKNAHETLAHELGHTLFLNDEYNPDVPGRNLDGWDLMDDESTLPHLTLPFRMQLGWVDANWLKLYNFLTIGTQVDEAVKLSPVEAGAPPANHYIGIEVRIGDGRNYYFEYRRGQVVQIGDRQLAPDSRVVGVDISEPPDPPTILRPEGLLLPAHADDNGGVLDVGQFYHEVDNTTPTYPSDFRVKVNHIEAAYAEVQVQYGAIGKPDPSIRPWPRSDQFPWQSPDIEVSNARSLADPAWANVPWLGHNNTVTAQIKNAGTLNAPGVVANFYVKDYTISDAPETWIGFDRQTVAPNATVPFTVTWPAPAPVDPATPLHYCVVVRIDPYDAPTVPPIHEMTDANNVAQSNYDRFISATASPGSREITAVSIHNPFPRPTRFFICAGQNNPLYRTYVENTWLMLQPDEIRRVRVMFEWAPEAPQSDPHWQPGSVDKYYHVVNRVTLLGSIENPLDKRLHGPRPVSGVQADVVHGDGTRFAKFEAGEHFADGQIVRISDGAGVPGGSVILIIRVKDKEGAYYYTGNVHQDGTFGIEFKETWQEVEAYYVPAPHYADCKSEVIRR
jgi:M6 family metalloprotease-like protein